MYEVQDGFPSVQQGPNLSVQGTQQSRSALQQPQPPQVQFDGKGRELAPCGCLKRTPPPPPPNEPPFQIDQDNVNDVKNWFIDTYYESNKKVD